MPFGGKVVVLGGDFRQTLPVVRRGTRASTISACIKRTELWQHFETLHLVRNMRAGADELVFADWLLRLGDGLLPCNADNVIELPAECICREDLVKSVF